MNSSLPSPVSWPTSQYWDGDDGPWSSFALRIGTPEQVVRVLPSTAGQATWVVVPEACWKTTEATSDCEKSRGTVFDYNSSSTWQKKGWYHLTLEANLGYNTTNEVALWGRDTLGLGYSNTSNVPSLDSQLIAGFVTEDYHLGMFGLGPEPTNFSVFTDSYPSFLTTLKSQNKIPSLSWAYTAGAQYQGKGFFGSLTFGGYDSSRFIPSNVSFPMAPDISRDLVVGLKAITSTSPQTVSFLQTPINAFIDSTQPLLWLPAEACKTFEAELKLQLDSSTGLYLISDELHQNLTDSNWSFTFQITDYSTAGGPSVDIVLPYASFDLKLTPPYLTNTTRYFPIIAAQDESQYTLGRTFLQEAYLIANYEASNFSVSPCRFDDTLSQNLVPILSRNSSNTTTPVTAHPLPPRRSHHLRGGSIAGITVGSIAFLALLVLLILWARRKWWGSPCGFGNPKSNSSGPSSSSPPAEELESPISPILDSSVQEIDGHGTSRFEEMADTGLAELPQSRSDKSPALASRAASRGPSYHAIVTTVEKKNELDILPPEKIIPETSKTLSISKAQAENPSPSPSPRPRPR